MAKVYGKYPQEFFSAMLFKRICTFITPKS